MNKDSKIYVAGHRGMVGSAIVRELNRQYGTDYISVMPTNLYGPNDTPRKLLDVSKAKGLACPELVEGEDGIRLAYEDFLNNPMKAER